MLKKTKKASYKWPIFWLCFFLSIAIFSMGFSIVSACVLPSVVNSNMHLWMFENNATEQDWYNEIEYLKLNGGNEKLFIYQWAYGWKQAYDTFLIAGNATGWSMVVILLLYLLFIRYIYNDRSINKDLEYSKEEKKLLKEHNLNLASVD